MLREDDFLFGPIRRLIEVVSRAEREHVEVDAAVRDLVGLDLATVDALTPAALAALLSGDDDRAVARRTALAELLEALAAPGAEGEDRREKARVLRWPLPPGPNRAPPGGPRRCPRSPST